MRAKSLKIKIRSGYNWIESQGNKQSVQWLTWGIYTLIIIVFACRHEPWGDEYHAWGMVNQMDFPQLWKAMRVEGHFVLWHLCLWPFVKWFGMDWHSLYCVSVPLMSLAAWLFLFKVRFPFVGKLLVVFSAPFFYYYPVIARCYALIPPILMGLAILYQQKKYPILYCILLGLLANTHAYIEGLVGILWCLFVYKEVVQKWKTQPHEAKHNLLASMLTVVIVLFALMQVIGGLVDMSQGHDPVGEGKNSPERWLGIFYGGYQIDFFDWLHRHGFRFIPKLDFVLTLICYILLIISVYNVIKKERERKGLLLILFFGLCWQILFAINIYGMNWQRIGMLYFVMVFVFLLCNHKKVKYMLIALSLLWMLNTSSNYKIIKDLWQPFDGNVYIAKTIQQLIPNDAVFFLDVASQRGLIDASIWKTWDINVQKQLEESQTKDFWLFTLQEKHDDAIGCFEKDECSVDLVYSDGYYGLYHIKK